VETGNAMEELTAILDRGDDDEDGGAVPQWMIDLKDQAEKWLEDIPESMEKLVEKSDSIKNPLFRFMRREFTIGRKVLNLLNSGLNDLVQFVNGEIKATNTLRKIVDGLSKRKFQNDGVCILWLSWV